MLVVVTMMLVVGLDACCLSPHFTDVGGWMYIQLCVAFKHALDSGMDRACVLKPGGRSCVRCCQVEWQCWQSNSKTKVVRA